MERKIDRLITIADYEDACCSFSEQIISAKVVAGQKRDGSYDAEMLSVVVTFDETLSLAGREQLKTCLADYLRTGAELTIAPKKLSILEAIPVKVSVEVWMSETAEEKEAAAAFEMITHYLKNNSLTRRTKQELEFLLTMELGKCGIRFVSIYAEHENKSISLEEIETNPFFCLVGGIHKVYAKNHCYEAEQETKEQTDVFSVNEHLEFGGKAQEKESSLLTLKSDFIHFLQQADGQKYRFVNAWMDSAKKKLIVSILPKQFERFDKIEEQELERLTALLSDKVTLGTKLQVMGPVFAGANVYGVIYVHPYFANCREEITDMIRNQVDYLAGGKQMGESLTLKQLYDAVMTLDCVNRIESLKLLPIDDQIKMEGGDFVLDGNCMLYPQEISLELLPWLGR